MLSTTEIFCSESNTFVGLAGDETRNSRPVTSAHGQLVAIRHGDKALSIVSIGAKFLYMLKIHDRGTMNAQENVGVQLSLEISHCIAQHMALSAGADFHIILFRANPPNIRNGEKQDAPFGAKDQPVVVFLLFRRSS